MRWRTATATGWLLVAAATGGCYHQYLRVTRSDQLPEKEQKTVYSYAWDWSTAETASRCAVRLGRWTRSRSNPISA